MLEDTLRVRLFGLHTMNKFFRVFYSFCIGTAQIIVAIVLALTIVIFLIALCIGLIYITLPLIERVP
jgi:hypothetical protein